MFRYSDFIVNEVDLDGNVVHLTSLDAPPEVLFSNLEFFLTTVTLSVIYRFFADGECITLINQMVEEKEVKISDRQDKSYTTEIESFRALAGDYNADSLKVLIDQINSAGEDNGTPTILSPCSDKSHRTVCFELMPYNLFIQDLSGCCMIDNIFPFVHLLGNT